MRLPRADDDRIARIGRVPYEHRLNEHRLKSTHKG